MSTLFNKTMALISNNEDVNKLEGKNTVELSITYDNGTEATLTVIGVLERTGEPQE